jgi:hypothetical protein
MTKTEIQWAFGGGGVAGVKVAYVYDIVPTLHIKINAMKPLSIY